MTLKQALGALKKAGTAQNRKIYGNHGVTITMYGVSFAELKKLKKQIGTDTDLARQLWATGNHDARILACMIAGNDDLAALAHGKDGGSVPVLPAVVGHGSQHSGVINRRNGARDECFLARIYAG